MSKIIESEFVNLVDTGARYDELGEDKDKIPNDFYTFDRKQLFNATTPAYRQFLKEAGYVDLDNCEELHVSKGMYKWGNFARLISQAYDFKFNGKRLTGEDNEYVVNIDRVNAKQLAQALGFNLLTTNLMYNLFIPYIKEETEKDNEDAQNTLEEMINTKAEWLEDLIIDQTKLKINSKNIDIDLHLQTGRFNRIDLNEFGYPRRLTDNGEFNYWSPRFDEMAVIRGASSELDLNLSGVPSFDNDKIGLRLAKFVMEKK